MVVVDERAVTRQEPPPHGKIGMSTAYRISDAVPNRTMEFRKRALHVGAAIGEHVIAHDEVYYVLSGDGEVVSDGKKARLKPGHGGLSLFGRECRHQTAWDEPLVLIISYPVTRNPRSSAGRHAHRPGKRLYRSGPNRLASPGRLCLRQASAKP